MAAASSSKGRTLAGRACHSSSALMRAAGRTVKRGSQVTSYDLSGLGYLSDASDAFVATADVEFVVQGRRLPVHSQLLARSCEVWAALFDSVASSGGTIPLAAVTHTSPLWSGTSSPAHRTYAQVVAEVVAAEEMDQPLVFEKAFEGETLEAVDNFLWCIYHPEGVQAHVEQGPLDLAGFSAQLELADRFNFALLLQSMTAMLHTAVTGPSAPFGEQMHPTLLASINGDIYGWLDLAATHNLDDLKPYCLSNLLSQLASPATSGALLASDAWQELPGSTREMLLEAVLSAAHRCQRDKHSVTSTTECPECDEVHKVTVKDVCVLQGSHLTVRLPDWDSLLAWKAPGGFATN